MQPDENARTAPVPNSENRHTARQPRARQTSAGILLQKAVARLGAAQLAATLGVASEVIERLTLEGRPLDLVQQRTLAVAVLTLSEEHPDLRRRAAALLAQIQAAEDFATGQFVARHFNAPELRWERESKMR